MTLSIEEREALTQRVEGLPEIEFVELLRSMARIIERNGWEHVIDDCFDITTYEHQLDDANDLLKETRLDLNKIVAEPAAADWMRTKIQNVVDNLILKEPLI